MIRIFVLTLLILMPSLAVSKDVPSPTILEADRIDGDRENNIIHATGNVEVTKGKNILKSDEIIYNKNDKIIDAKGNIQVKGDELGNIYATKAKIKDDFTSGEMSDGEIIFDDGSYTTSPNIKRKDKSTNILQNSIFSFCPNPGIVEDNKKVKDDVGLITVKSSKTTINKEDGVATVKHGRLRIKNIPIFYTPYLRFPLRDGKRKSGFLNPSYTNTDNLGFGVKIPYYFNIAPNKDLTTTTQYHPAEKNIIVNNKYRHLLEQGSYDVELEVANNNLTATEDESSRRGLLRSNGNFVFDEDEEYGLKLQINYVADKHYLRDYHNDYIGHSVSEIDFNQITTNKYNSIKTVKIQELEINKDSREEITAIPIFDSFVKSNIGKANETYSLRTNATILSRRSGLQYRRLSFTPEVSMPYNISGNIFNLSASVQGNFYNLDDNYTSTPKTTEFDHTELDYRPQASISWRLPLIKRMKDSSFIVEPQVSIVSSSYSKNDNHIPNEDTNDTELTHGNLFLKDRFVGYDRNETGERVNYGFSSNLFTDLGNFGLGLGQSYRENNKTQDVKIKGFDNSKSNIVGEMSYKTEKIFSLVYNFQLSESDYVNDVNELHTSLNFERVSLSSSYILIRESSSNSIPREQISMGASAKIYGKANGHFSATRDLVSDTIISKLYGINYDGCCVTYGLSISESNPSQFFEAEKSYNIHFTIKNL